MLDQWVRPLDYLRKLCTPKSKYLSVHPILFLFCLLYGTGILRTNGPCGDSLGAYYFSTPLQCVYSCGQSFGTLYFFAQEKKKNRNNDFLSKFARIVSQFMDFCEISSKFEHWILQGKFVAVRIAMVDRCVSYSELVCKVAFPNGTVAHSKIAM